MEDFGPAASSISFEKSKNNPSKYPSDFLSHSDDEIDEAARSCGLFEPAEEGGSQDSVESYEGAMFSSDESCEMEPPPILGKRARSSSLDIPSQKDQSSHHSSRAPPQGRSQRIPSHPPSKSRKRTMDSSNDEYYFYEEDPSPAEECPPSPPSFTSSSPPEGRAFFLSHFRSSSQAPKEKSKETSHDGPRSPVEGLTRRTDSQSSSHRPPGLPSVPFNRRAIPEPTPVGIPGRNRLPRTSSEYFLGAPRSSRRGVSFPRPPSPSHEVENPFAFFPPPPPLSLRATSIRNAAHESLRVTHPSSSPTPSPSPTSSAPSSPLPSNHRRTALTTRHASLPSLSLPPPLHPSSDPLNHWEDDFFGSSSLDPFSRSDNEESNPPTTSSLSSEDDDEPEIISTTFTEMSRDELLARQLQIMEQHFHRRAPSVPEQLRAGPPEDPEESSQENSEEETHPHPHWGSSVPQRSPFASMALLSFFGGSSQSSTVRASIRSSLLSMIARRSHHPLAPPSGRRVDPHMLRLSLMDRDFTDADYEMLLQLDASVPNIKGATQETIESIPTVEMEDGDHGRCVICLGEMEKGVLVRKLPCGHHFHVECIDEWLKINKVCPIDKKSIVEESPV